MKKIEDNTKNGNISNLLGLEEFILLKRLYNQKQSADLMQSISINTHDIFRRSETNNSNTYMEPQRTPECQRNLEKKEHS